MVQEVPGECPECGGAVTHVGPQAPSVFRVQCTRDSCCKVMDVTDEDRCPPKQSDTIDTDIEAVIDEHVGSGGGENV